jgi:aminopeptidase N
MLCRHAVAQDDAVWPGRAYHRVKNASNLTDRLGAVVALTDSHSPLADPAMAVLYDKARGDALMLDKWFMLQARRPEPLGEHAGSAFTRAKALLKHPDFTLRNPNRARSLLFTLTQHNPAAFHRSDAAGYVLWAEKLLELDALNPQLAARLAGALNRISLLVEPFQSAAREALVRVAAKHDLSSAVREIIEHALEPQP